MADDSTLPILNTTMQKMGGVLSSLERTLFKQTNMLGSLTNITGRLSKNNERADQNKRLEQAKEEDRLRDERRAKEHKGNQKEESDKKSHSLIESLTASLNRITDFTKSTKNIGISIFSGIFTLLKGASFLGLIALAVPIVKNFFDGFLEGINLGIDDLPDSLKNVIDGFSNLNNVLEKVGSALETASGWLSWLNSSNPEVTNEHPLETLGAGSAVSGILGFIRGWNGNRLGAFPRMFRDGILGYGILSGWNQLMDTLGIDSLKFDSSWSTVFGAGAGIGLDATGRALSRRGASGSAMAGEALGAEGAAGRAAAGHAARGAGAGLLSRIASGPVGRVIGGGARVAGRVLGPVGWAMMVNDFVQKSNTFMYNANQLLNAPAIDDTIEIGDTFTWILENLKTQLSRNGGRNTAEAITRVRQFISQFPEEDWGQLDQYLGGIEGITSAFMKNDSVANDVANVLFDLHNGRLIPGGGDTNPMLTELNRRDIFNRIRDLRNNPESVSNGISLPEMNLSNETIIRHDFTQPPLRNLPVDQEIASLPIENESRRGFQYGILGRLITGLNPIFTDMEDRLPETNLNEILQRIGPPNTSPDFNWMNMSAPVVNNSGGNVSNVTNNSIVNIVQSSLDRSPWTLTT